jgi:hypothetical protein
MTIGIGPPAAVPGADMIILEQWAAESERAGFAAVGVIDRLLYVSLDPAIARAARSNRARRPGHHRPQHRLAQQLDPARQADGLAGPGLQWALLAGLGTGWLAGGLPRQRVLQSGSAPAWESSLRRCVRYGTEAPWPGGGPTPEFPEGRPARLFGGTISMSVDASSGAQVATA